MTTAMYLAVLIDVWIGDLVHFEKNMKMNLLLNELDVLEHLSVIEEEALCLAN